MIPAFNLCEERIANNERFKIEDGKLVKEDVGIRSSASWCSRFITRGEYSQSKILNIIKKEYKKASEAGELSDELIHNYEFAINKAEAQNIRHEDSSAFVRFFKAKSYININKHYKTWAGSLQTTVKPGPVTKGQGDYIAFYPDGSKLTQETFNQVYAIFNDYTPMAIVKRGVEDPSRRDLLIKEKIKEIDPELEIAFVPRTLYELIFIRKCISEDVRHNGVCNFVSRAYEEQMTKEDYAPFEELEEVRMKDVWAKCKENRCAERLARHCWHFRPQTGEETDNQKGLESIAYRLNKAIVKALNPTETGFTYDELCTKAEFEIDFLKNHFNQFSENPVPASPGLWGPTRTFSMISSVGQTRPLSIHDETGAEMIRKCVALECSRVAEKSLLLVRGANFKKDSAETTGTDKKCPYSQSFGTSLLAGAVFDNGATAFGYMLNEKNAYAVSLPFNQIEGSPFVVPSQSSLRQLYGQGETFHARTKAWKDTQLEDIKGFPAGGGTQGRPYVQSDLSRKQIRSGFKKYKAAAVHLK